MRFSFNSYSVKFQYLETAVLTQWPCRKDGSRENNQRLCLKPCSAAALNPAPPQSAVHENSKPPESSIQSLSLVIPSRSCGAIPPDTPYAYGRKTVSSVFLDAKARSRSKNSRDYDVVYVEHFWFSQHYPVFVFNPSSMCLQQIE